MWVTVDYLLITGINKCLFAPARTLDQIVPSCHPCAIGKLSCHKLTNVKSQFYSLIESLFSLIDYRKLSFHSITISQPLSDKPSSSQSGTNHQPAIHSPKTNHLRTINQPTSAAINQLFTNHYPTIMQPFCPHHLPRQDDPTPTMQTHLSSMLAYRPFLMALLHGSSRSSGDVHWQRFVHRLCVGVRVGAFAGLEPGPVGAEKPACEGEVNDGWWCLMFGKLNWKVKSNIFYGGTIYKRIYCKW